MTITRADAALSDRGPVVELKVGDYRREFQWGYPWQVGTAAYWIAATREAQGQSPSPDYRLGEDLREEVVACLLGGFGMPFETGLAAFRAVRDQLMRPKRPMTPSSIEAILREPLCVGGALRRYRFPHQRAERIAQALTFVGSGPTASKSPRELRDWLLGAPGIGMKTASWIVRNQCGSEQVAVLDIHVVRAGRSSGVFPPELTVNNGYRQLEALFVAWAAKGGVSAAKLDAVIWAEQAYWARHRADKRGAVD